MNHIKYTLTVVATIALCAAGSSASEPQRFPLIWQARSTQNADGASVIRLHDPEAGVNCYIVQNPEFCNGVGCNISPASISCVKMR